MKAKKAAPSRRRVSFAVDRDEIEINSDWVEAVMAFPTASATPPVSSPAIIVPFPSRQQAEVSPAVPAGPAPALPSVPISSGEAFFFGLEENNATGAKNATDEQCTSV